MTEFRVGDRVEWAGSPSMKAEIPGPGTVVHVEGYRLFVKMDDPSGQPTFVAGEGAWRGLPEGVRFNWQSCEADWRLIAPRKDAPSVGSSPAGVSAGNAKAVPAVGDTVRVVIEGKVGRLAGGLAWLESANDGWNYGIKPDSPYTKSVEILEPAKPSVKDLPGGSALRVKYLGVMEKAEHGWLQAGTKQVYTDAFVDEQEWVQLVPQESE